MTKKKTPPKIHRAAEPEVARAKAAQVDDVALAAQDDSTPNPTTAFEEVRHDLVDVEALAVAAEDSLEAIPYTSNPEHSRKLGRLFSLVEATAAAAKAALDKADETLATLNEGSDRPSQARQGEASTGLSRS